MDRHKLCRTASGPSCGKTSGLPGEVWPDPAVSALAAKIPPRHQGMRLSGVLLKAMAGLARDAGLFQLIAPVRPNHKDRCAT